MSLLHHPHEELQATRCPACGRENRASARFCAGCGLQREVAAAAPTGVADHAGTPPQPPTQAVATPPPVPVEVLPAPEATPSGTPSRRGLRAALAVLGLAAAAVLVLLLLPAPDIVATSLEVPEVSVIGELVVIAAEVVNEGDAAGQQDLTLLIDGNAVQTRTAELEPEAQDTISFTLTDLRPGTYEVSLAELEGVQSLLWIMNRPTLDAPSRIVAGESVQVEITVANTGPAAVSHEVGVAVDGDPTANRILRLPAGTEETVMFTLTDLTPGLHRLAATVGGWQGRGSELRVLRPASFHVSGLRVEPPGLVDLNDSTELTVVTTIANRGEVEGVYGMRVELDGELVEERELDLDGSTELEETVVMTVTDAGTHEVRVGDETVSFVAYRLERPANGTVLSNDLGGGSNRLRIVNDTPEDFVVALVRPGEQDRSLLSVYVRSESSHTVFGISSGDFQAYYTSGSDWCTHHKRFTFATDHGRFEEVHEYRSTSDYYTQVDLSFGSFDGPGSPSEFLFAEDFPAL